MAANSKGQLHPLRNFGATHAKEAGTVISNILNAKLKDEQYNPDYSAGLTKDIADEVKIKLKGMSENYQVQSKATFFRILHVS